MARRKSGKTTIYTLGKEAGVSPSTISRALSNSHSISAEVRERIQQLARKNGFRPRVVTLRAPKDDPEVGGDYYGLPWPCWGTPEFRHPGTPILYNTNLPVKEGGGTFRARFGVERVVKRKVMESGQEVEKEEHDNLLAEG